MRLGWPRRLPMLGPGELGDEFGLLIILTRDLIVTPSLVRVLPREDALRLACDLIRGNWRVYFIQGPENEKIHAVAIADWCKAHPSRDRRPPLK